MAVNISSLASEFGAYYRKNSETIMESLFRDNELEKEMTSIPDVVDEWGEMVVETGQILQPWQASWVEVGQTNATTPGQAVGQVAGASGTGSAVFVVKGRKFKVRPIMHKSSFGDIDALVRSWAGFMTDESKSIAEWPFVRYLIEKEILPKAAEEMDDISARGDYTAPTAGVPGSVLSCTDGILTILADEIAASNLAPIASGSFTSADIFENVQEFVKSIPSHMRKRGYTLMMSDTNALNLWQNYCNTFGLNPSVFTGDNLKINILGTKIQVKGFAAFGSSNRFVYTSKANMKKLYDKHDIAEGIKAEVILDKLYVHFKFKRGYGFSKLSQVFVNDQA